MARHIMAVCVVCLLCADHLPCQEHLDLIGSTSRDGKHQQQQQQQNMEYQQLNAKVFQRNNIPPSTTSPAIDATDQQQQYSYAASSSVNGRQHAHHRRKRHAGGHAHESTTTTLPEITTHFVQRIFDEYAQGKDVIGVDEFHHMLQRLQLHNLVEQRLGSDKIEGSTCIPDTKLVEYAKMHNHVHEHHLAQEEAAHISGNCTDPLGTGQLSMPCEEMLSGSHNGSVSYSNYSLNAQDMLNLCPVLLYQLSSTSERLRAGCIDNEVLLEIDQHDAIELNAEKEDMVYVWMYAFISVSACSILGLVGVAIIPFMDSRFYKHIIQFLVSLAVGTMTGDALLHLLPHSLAGQSESNMIFKGLTCMSGIIFFYITEHGLTMISEWRKRIAKKEPKKPSRAKIVRDPDSSITHSTGGDKLCKSKYSSYPYCYDEIAMDSKSDVWMHLPNNTNTNTNTTETNGKALELEANEMAAQSLLSTSQNQYAPIAEMNHHHHHHSHGNKSKHHEQQQQPIIPDNSAFCTDLGTSSLNDGVVSVAPNANGKDKLGMNDTVTVILREHESTHHGHSHKHGHVHSPPESLSAVAWMIIMGDGLHNFTDGMAIGAAFAENIAGGFSTSLAVFCHELPHELGDFAILLKAGMSVKSAVYYNLLTGVLSFIGMIFGIIFGQSHDTAQWMFAAAAGLFIYIALVDMMPELSAAHKSLEQFILQILGMSAGVGIMLLIALYEGDLMNVFSKTSSVSTPTAATTTSQHLH